MGKPKNLHAQPMGYIPIPIPIPILIHIHIKRERGRHIYCKELAHMTVEAEKSQHLESAGWGLRGADGVVPAHV